MVYIIYIICLSLTIPLNPLMHGRFYRPKIKVLWEVVKKKFWIYFLKKDGSGMICQIWIWMGRKEIKNLDWQLIGILPDPDINWKTSNEFKHKRIRQYSDLTNQTRKIRNPCWQNGTHGMSFCKQNKVRNGKQDPYRHCKKTEIRKDLDLES